MPSHPAAARRSAGHNQQQARGGMAQNPLSKSQERIYSAQQLVQALRSAHSALRDQLQVLTILDSTAMSWPGLQQAVDDLEFLIDMSSQTTNRLETDHRSMEGEVKDSQIEVATLKETLAMANEKQEELQREVAQLNKDYKAINSKLETANKDKEQQRQELWTLEKQRADLASECEKLKQDNDFMEGEMNGLRAAVADNQQQITNLKEELAAKKSEATHLRQLTADQKSQIDHLSKQLESTSAQANQLQATLSHTQQEKIHFERESDRLQDESGRLAAELTKTSKELERLKEWQEVLKRVEADKVRDAQDSHTKDKLDFEARKSALEKTITQLNAELAARDDKLGSKSKELEHVQKQVGMLNLQIRDLQKQVTTLQTEKVATTKARDEARAQIGKLQAQQHQSNLKHAQFDKDRALTEQKLKEHANAEGIRLQSLAEESRREAAVQKALSEGWSRDLRETQERLREEQARCTGLQERLEAMQKEQQTGSMETVRAAVNVEQTIKNLQEKLEAREAELRKLKAEASSMQKMLEKQVERLQRECNESALEVQRLQAGDGPRLPALGQRPNLALHEDLVHLKKMLMSNGPTSPGAGKAAGPAGRLPAVAPHRHAQVAVRAQLRSR